MTNTAVLPTPPPGAGAIQPAPQATFVRRPAAAIMPARPSGFATVLISPSTNANFQNSLALNEEGDRFSILSSNLPVKIQPVPAGRAETYYMGMTGNFERPFKALQVTNTSKTTGLVLKIWVGFEDLQNFTTPLLPVTAIEGLTVIKATGVVQPLSTVDAWVRTVWMYGYSALAAGVAPVNNGANVYTGKSALYQPDILAPGQSQPYAYPDGQWMNLANVFIWGTQNDAIFYTAT